MLNIKKCQGYHLKCSETRRRTKKSQQNPQKGSQFGEDYKNNTKYLFSPEVFKPFFKRFKKRTLQDSVCFTTDKFYNCGEPMSHQSFSVFIFMRMLDWF